jgi:hypothetical protein
MNIQQAYRGNELPWDERVADTMSWDQMNSAAHSLEASDRLWKQARGEEILQLAGLFGQSDVMSLQAHKAYKEAMGESLWGGSPRQEKPTGPDYSRAVGGPSGMNVKSEQELQSQAEMMARARGTTVQRAMDAIRRDWMGKGIMVR